MTVGIVERDGQEFLDCIKDRGGAYWEINDNGALPDEGRPEALLLMGVGH